MSTLAQVAALTKASKGSRKLGKFFPQALASAPVAAAAASAGEPVTAVAMAATTDLAVAHAQTDPAQFAPALTLASAQVGVVPVPAPTAASGYAEPAEFSSELSQTIWQEAISMADEVERRYDQNIHDSAAAAPNVESKSNEPPSAQLTAVANAAAPSSSASQEDFDAAEVDRAMAEADEYMRRQSAMETGSHLEGGARSEGAPPPSHHSPNKKNKKNMRHLHST